MCVVEDRAGRCFVYAAALHTDKTVFHDVDSADCMLGAEFVQLAHDVRRGKFFTVDLDRNTFDKLNDHIFCFISSLRERLGHDVDLFRTFGPGIFQNTAFKGDMQQVAVHGIGLLQRAADRNIVLTGIFDHFGTGMEIPVGITPCSNDLGCGVQSISVQLETDLVVALAGGTVADGISAFLFADIDQTFCNERTGNGGTQQVVAFVDGICLHHGEDEIAGKFFGQVFHIALGGTGTDRLFFQPGSFFRLPDICAVADNFCIVSVFDPLDDDGCIKSARISNDDLH